MKILFLILLFFNFSSFLFAQQEFFIKTKDYKNKITTHVRTIVLKSSDMVVTLDAATGLPYMYNYKGSTVWGEDSTHKINIIICNLLPREYKTVTVLPLLADKSYRHAEFLFETSFNGHAAVSFHLKYVLDTNALIITMEKVIEHEGFQLIEADLSHLATIREEDGPGWLADGRDGGELVSLKDAINNHLPYDENFGNIGYVLPVEIVGSNHVQCAMEVTSFMDGTRAEIVGNKGNHHARIGTIKVYRVHGGRAYNMNNGQDAIKGNAQTPNLLVGQLSSCRLDFTGDYDGNGKVDWLDGAKIIAKRMPAIPTKYFNDKFMYLIAGKYKPEDNPRTTFVQSEKIIRDIAMLTDNAPQLLFISGWVYSGQDTGFPSEDSVNATLGGHDGLEHLMEEGKNYNANVSLNVNYDDAYRSSPLFDTAFIARRPDGKIWRSMDWDGEYSYIVGLAKYMKNWGEKRVAYTVNNYKIHDAILVDALSWYAIRNDWDAMHPASGYKNLVDGRYKIIDVFRKHGIQVVSEQLRYPFIGKIAVSADGLGGGSHLFGGEGIPFLATIYRKSAIWGTGNFSQSDTRRSLFWNCRSIQWYKNASNRNDIIDYYFMTVLPFNKVHDKAVEGYKRTGFKTEIDLENNSKIINDWMTNDYSIIANGIEIAASDATFCPLDNDRIACYSRNTKELNLSLPKEWDATTIVARALFIDHREDVPLKIDNGKIIVSLKSGIPIIIYRNEKIAEMRR